MTSQNAIQSLIAEIDAILPKASSPLAWFTSRDLHKQRRVLERVRNYLVSLSQKSGSDQPSDAARLIGIEVVQQIESLRASLMQPFQAEVEALRKERELLIKEIRTLESTQQQYNSIAQQQAKQQQIISEFVQMLTGRLQESLTAQVAQTLENLETQFISAEAARSINEEVAAQFSSGEKPLHPSARLEQVRQMQIECDRMLINFDSSLRAVLEALERNILGYEESLSQGVSKMYSLGHEGEVIFTALVNYLANDLGKEVTSYLPEAAGQVSHTTSMPATNNLSFPYPGMEIDVPALESLERSQPDEASFAPDAEIINSQEDTDWQNWEIIEEAERNASWEADLEEITRILEMDTEIELTLDEQNLDEQNTEQHATPEAAIAENYSPPEFDEEYLTPIESEAEPQLTSPDITNEIDEFYSVLFGNEDHKLQSEISTPTNLTAPIEDNNNLANESQLEQQNYFEEQVNGSGVPIDLGDGEELKIEEVLFEGLPDLAEADASLTEETAAQAESWEEFLFAEVSDSSTLPDAEAKNRQNTPQLDQGNLLNPEGTATLEWLESLLDVSNEKQPLNDTEDTSQSVVDSPETETENEADSEIIYRQQYEEDIYIPASPDENLLEINEPDANQANEIILDQNTLQLLSEDLVSFELDEIQNAQDNEQEIDSVTDAAVDWSAGTLDSTNYLLNLHGRADEVLADYWEEFTVDTLNDQLSDEPSEIVGLETENSSPELQLLVSDAAELGAGLTTDEFGENIYGSSNEPDLEPELLITNEQELTARSTTDEFGENIDREQSGWESEPELLIANEPETEVLTVDEFGENPDDGQSGWESEPELLIANEPETEVLTVDEFGENPDNYDESNSEPELLIANEQETEVLTVDEFGENTDNYDDESNSEPELLIANESETEVLTVDEFGENTDDEQSGWESEPELLIANESETEILTVDEFGENIDNYDESSSEPELLIADEQQVTALSTTDEFGENNDNSDRESDLEPELSITDEQQLTPISITNEFGENIDESNLEAELLMTDEQQLTPISITDEFGENIQDYGEQSDLSPDLLIANSEPVTELSTTDEFGQSSDDFSYESNEELELLITSDEAVTGFSADEVGQNSEISNNYSFDLDREPGLLIWNVPIAPEAVIEETRDNPGWLTPLETTTPNNNINSEEELFSWERVETPINLTLDNPSTPDELESELLHPEDDSQTNHPHPESENHY